MAKAKGQSALDREQIVSAALRLLNEVGLDGLTLRKVAGELNVQAPALYWHVRNKQELLDEMATAILREVSLAHEGGTDAGSGDGSDAQEGAAGGARAAARPQSGPDGSDAGTSRADAGTSRADAGAGWQELLADAGRSLRRALLRYRDGAKVFAGTRLTDTGHAPRQEAMLRRLVADGFSPGAAARAAFIVFIFTEGFVIEQQAVEPAPGVRGPGYDLAERAEAIGPEFPLSGQAGADLFGDFDARFEEGLTAVITGIGATLRP